MKVIIIKNHPQIGSVGQVKEVSDGYAANYLFPQGLAVVADDKNLREWQNKIKAINDKKVAEIASAKKMAARLQKATVKILVKANAAGKIFGSIHATEIVERLKSQGIIIEPKDLLITEPFKKLGQYQVGFHLIDGSVGTVTVVLEPKEETKT